MEKVKTYMDFYPFNFIRDCDLDPNKCSAESIYKVQKCT